MKNAARLILAVIYVAAATLIGAVTAVRVLGAVTPGAAGWAAYAVTLAVFIAGAVLGAGPPLDWAERKLHL